LQQYEAIDGAEGLKLVYGRAITRLAEVRGSEREHRKFRRADGLTRCGKGLLERAVIRAGDRSEVRVTAEVSRGETGKLAEDEI